MKSDTITARADKRRKHARALLDEYTNDWDGSDDLDELAGSRYAVVTSRESDAWVSRAANALDVARCILATCQTDGPETEWITAVVDLDTGEEIAYTSHVRVDVRLPDGDYALTSD